MEFPSFESLSREEILQIFEQRHLDINDMYNLTREELVRIYKTFALPLSRRPQRHHNKHTSFQVRQIDRCEQDEDDQMLASAKINTPMEIELTPPQLDNGGGYMKTASPISSIGEKRRPSQEDLIDNYQYHLSRATKRIKINAMF